MSPTIRLLPADDAPRLWGLEPSVRLSRMLARYGAALDQPGEGTLLLRADAVYDAATLEALLAHPGCRLVDPEGHPLAIKTHDDPATATAWLLGSGDGGGLPVVTPAGIGTAYNERLRKREVPYARRVAGSEARKVEWRLFTGSYKGVTDLVTKYLWPLPAFHVTRSCARLGIRPNWVTSVGALLTVAAFFLFLHAHYLPGLACAWAMTFLDTVDGKLARCTLTSSKWGNVFDHGIDLAHPPFWYVAWGLGLAREGLPLPPETLSLNLWIVCAGYVLGRVFEGYFIKRFGIELHVWRRFDSRFRLIVARRNPNLLILTGFALPGRPDLGLVAISIWTVIGLLVHLVQVVQAEEARRRGEGVVSWLSR